MSLSDSTPPRLRAGEYSVALGPTPRLMGIINVTPDSFADGGRYLDPAAAIDHGQRLVDEGADLLDLGAESTRPGAEPVTAAIELQRILPVLRELHHRVSVPISVDTYKAEVARACLGEGATMVNDISGLTFDPDMATTVAEGGAALCLMHTPAPPRTMQEHAHYDDVVREVVAALAGSVARAEAAGIGRDRLLVDPGIGFGKNAAHNWEILRRLDELQALGLPVLIGASRKSFIGLALAEGSGAGEPWPVEERREGSLAVAAWCALHGIAVLRVHDVDATARVLKMIGKLTN